MKKYFYILMIVFSLYITGCTINQSIQTTNLNTISTTTTEATTTTNLKAKSFLEMYLETLNEMMNANGYTYQFMYTVSAAGTTSETTTDVLVDNLSTHMKLTSSITQTIYGNTQSMTLDPVYISQHNNQFYAYNKNGSQYIANQLKDDTLFSISDKDLGTDIPLESLDVEKINDYQYTVNIPLESIDTDDMMLQEVLSSLGVTDSKIQDVNILVTYNFDPETNQLQSIDMDMSEFLIELYHELFPEINFGNVQMNIVYTIKQIGNVSVNISNLDNAVYDDAPNELFDDTLVYPSYNIGDILCNFEYLYDTDTYEISVDNDGKYILQFSQDDLPIQLQVYDREGNLLVNATTDYLSDELNSQNPVAYDLKAGTYYISATYVNEYQMDQEPTITFTKVENDDYSDSYTNESNYPVKQVNNTTEFDGHIDYKGDVDVIHINKTSTDLVRIQVTYDDLFFVSLIGSNDSVSYRSYDLENGVYDFYLDNTMNGDIFLVLSSNDSTKDYHIKVTYYNEANDEGNSIDDNDLNSLSVGKELTGAFNLNDKVDAYQLTITEPGYYNFSKNAINQSSNAINFISLSLYDQDKQIVNGNNGSYYLEAGTYYVKVNYDQGNLCLYIINVEKAVDDLPDVKEITLNDVNKIDTSIDYAGDVDTYQFNIVDNSVYKLVLRGIENSGQGTVTIKDINGKVVDKKTYMLSYINGDFSDTTDYAQNSTTYIYLTPGQYTLEVQTSHFGHYYVYFDKTTEVTDDYLAGTSLENEMGVLHEGDNTIHINYSDDKDMYVFEALQDGEYFFIHDFNAWFSYAGFISFTDEAGNIYKLDDQRTQLYLIKGKYYFNFVYGSASYHTISIEYNDPSIPDESNLTIIDPLNNSSTNIKGQINAVNDEDEYQITLESDGLLTIDATAFYYSFSYQLLDSNQNIIIDKDGLYNFSRDGFNFWIQSAYANLKAGTYIIKVTDPLYSQYPYYLNLTQDSNMQDDYSNSFAGGNFGTFTIGDNIVHSEYPTDVDIFKVTFNADGAYYFVNSDSINYIAIYDANYNLLTYQDNFIGFCPVIKAGTYYIVFYSPKAGDYKINLTKYQ